MSELFKLTQVLRKLPIDEPGATELAKLIEAAHREQDELVQALRDSLLWSQETEDRILALLARFPDNAAVE